LIWHRNFVSSGDLINGLASNFDDLGLIHIRRLMILKKIGIMPEKGGK
jgi:hypothetical protein